MIIYSAVIAIVVLVYFLFLGFSVQNNFLKRIPKTIQSYILVGFFTLVFIQAPIAFTASYFHISWQKYMYMMYFVFATSGLYILYFCIRNINSFKKDMKLFSKDVYTYFFIFIGLIYFGSSLVETANYFFPNYLDDGYYLSRLGSEIGQKSMGIIDPATGLESISDVKRIFSNYDLFWSAIGAIFKIEPVYLARSTMVLSHIFLILSSYIVFFSIAFPKAKRIWYYVPLILLAIPFQFLKEHHFVTAYSDVWRLTSAVWYGAALIQFISIPLFASMLIIIYQKDNKNIFFELFWLVLVSVVFINFGTQIAPILYMVTLVYAGIKLYSKHKIYRMLGRGYIGLMLCINLIINFVHPSFIGDSSLGQTYFGFIKTLLEYNEDIFLGVFGVIITCITLYVLFYTKNKVIHTLLGIIILFSFVPFFQGMLIFTSGFSFITSRFYYGIYYLMFMFTCFIISKFFYERQKLQYYVIVGIVFLYICRGTLFTITQENQPYLLRHEFDDYSNVNNQIVEDMLKNSKEKHPSILTPDFVYDGSKMFHIGVQLRMNSNKIINYGAIPRYKPADKDITDAVEKAKKVSACETVNKRDLNSHRFQKKIEELDADYVLLQDCLPVSFIKKLDGKIIKEYPLIHGNEVYLMKMNKDNENE